MKTWRQYGAADSTEPTYLAWEDRPRVTAETSTLVDAGVVISKTTSSEYDQFQNLTFAQETG